MSIKKNLGRVAFVYRGVFNPQTPYCRYDVALHKGALYVCKLNVPGTRKFNSPIDVDGNPVEHWALFLPGAEYYKPTLISSDDTISVVETDNGWDITTGISTKVVAGTSNVKVDLDATTNTYKISVSEPQPISVAKWENWWIKYPWDISNYVPPTPPTPPEPGPIYTLNMPQLVNSGSIHYTGIFNNKSLISDSKHQVAVVDGYPAVCIYDIKTPYTDLTNKPEPDESPSAISFPYYNSYEDWQNVNVKGYNCYVVNKHAATLDLREVQLLYIGTGLKNSRPQIISSQGNGFPMSEFGGIPKNVSSCDSSSLSGPFNDTLLYFKITEDAVLQKSGTTYSNILELTLNTLPNDNEPTTSTLNNTRNTLIYLTGRPENKLYGRYVQDGKVYYSLVEENYDLERETWYSIVWNTLSVSPKMLLIKADETDLPFIESTVANRSCTKQDSNYTFTINVNNTEQSCVIPENIVNKYFEIDGNNISLTDKYGLINEYANCMFTPTSDVCLEIDAHINDNFKSIYNSTNPICIPEFSGCTFINN